ncbi:MAG TPA: energy transducer TonB [Opitutaceae bacterium]|nr:energy transducer TonB [Opitutaceae bacterium]
MNFSPVLRAALLTPFIWLTGCETAPKAMPVPPSMEVGPGAARANVPARTDVHDVSRLDVAPKPTFMARPQYPFELRRQGIAGEAVVDFVVGPDGNVQNVHAVRESHPQFGAAAVQCVAKWKYSPGMKNGRPVYTHMQVPIVFTLNQQ